MKDEGRPFLAYEAAVALATMNFQATEVYRNASGRSGGGEFQLRRSCLSLHRRAIFCRANPQLLIIHSVGFESWLETLAPVQTA